MLLHEEVYLCEEKEFGCGTLVDDFVLLLNSFLLSPLSQLLFLKLVVVLNLNLFLGLPLRCLPHQLYLHSLLTIAQFMALRDGSISVV